MLDVSDDNGVVVLVASDGADLNPFWLSAALYAALKRLCASPCGVRRGLVPSALCEALSEAGTVLLERPGHVAIAPNTQIETVFQNDLQSENVSL